MVTAVSRIVENATQGHERLKQENVRAGALQDGKERSVKQNVIPVGMEPTAARCVDIVYQGAAVL